MEELQYHEQRDLKNKKKLQELLAALPSFCADFFRGIEPATSSIHSSDEQPVSFMIF